MHEELKILCDVCDWVLDDQGQFVGPTVFRTAKEEVPVCITNRHLQFYIGGKMIAINKEVAKKLLELLYEQKEAIQHPDRL